MPTYKLQNGFSFGRDNVERFIFVAEHDDEALNIGRVKYKERNFTRGFCFSRARFPASNISVNNSYAMWEGIIECANCPHAAIYMSDRMVNSKYYSKYFCLACIKQEKFKYPFNIEKNCIEEIKYGI